MEEDPQEEIMVVDRWEVATGETMQGMAEDLWVVMMQDLLMEVMEMVKVVEVTEDMAVALVVDLVEAMEVALEEDMAMEDLPEDTVGDHLVDMVVDHLVVEKELA